MVGNSSFGLKKDCDISQGNQKVGIYSITKF